MTYPGALKYLGSLINYEKIQEYPYRESLKLQRINGFLTSLGNPQASLKIIHIAGTKGKGSTCAFIAHILKETGFKAGLYTSPHLSDFRERIRILRQGKTSGKKCAGFEGMISKNELAALVKRLKPEIKAYNKYSKYGALSFFEVYTALAFIYFKEKKVDFAVMETGLGGRLDATNTADPLVCVITPISYEHTDKLGDTLSQIAAEKAGIIKNSKAIVVSAPQKKEARDVIRKRCKEMNARLYEIGKTAEHRKVSLLGGHQLINAAVAVKAVEALSSFGFNVPSSCIRKGLSNTVWPGRCEVVSKNPYLIVDGAQNRASANALKKAIKENFHYRRLTLVLGVSDDKDIAGVCSELDDLADSVVLTRADNPRAMAPAVLATYFPGKETYTTENLKDAKKLALELAGANDLILVTGSLFILGEFRK